VIRYLFLLGLLSATQAVLANGRVIHDSACMACHASLMGAANEMYTREDRRVKSYPNLDQQVANCQVAADVNWTAEQQGEVVNYLAKQFYHF